MEKEKKVTGSAIGYKNLIPNNKRTKEEVRKNARKGGVASGKVRKEKKLQREILEELLSMSIKDPKVIASLEKLGIAKKDMTNQTGINVALVNRAMRANNAGNKAYEIITDTLGEKEADKLQIDLPMQFVFKDDYGEE